MSKAKTLSVVLAVILALFTFKVASVQAQLESVLDLDWWAGELNRGDKTLVQKIYIADNDNTENHDDVMLTNLIVNVCPVGVANPGDHKDDPVPPCVGTAGARDIAKIEIWLLKEEHLGASTEEKIAEIEDFIDFPVQVPFLPEAQIASRTLADDGEGILKVMVTISNEPTDSHWVQLVTKMHYSEGGSGFFYEVGDSKPEHISNPGWVVTDKNKFNSPLKPGVEMPIQQFDVNDDHDGNSNPVQIAKFKVANLGTATNDDIAALRLTNCDTGTAKVIYGTAIQFGQEVELDDPPVTLDDGTGFYCIEVKVSDAPTTGRTFVLKTELTLQEGGVETQDVATIQAAIDSKEEVIAPPGCENYGFADLGPATIELGAEGVEMQSFTCIDSDPDDGDVTIKYVDIEKLGTATDDDMALIEVYEDGNPTPLGSATGYGRIVLDHVVPDGGCLDCQEDSSQSSSRKLTIKISINDHARTHDQDQPVTIRLQKTFTVQEQEFEWSYTHITPVINQSTIGGATVWLVGKGTNADPCNLEVHPRDEFSIDLLTNAPDLADIQVGTTTAILIDRIGNYPDNVSDYVHITDVIPCNEEHGNWPSDTPYEVLSWTKSSGNFIDAGDTGDEVLIMFTATLRPDRQPQEGCIVNIKGELDPSTPFGNQWRIDLVETATYTPVDEPDVFVDLLGDRVPLSDVIDGELSAADVPEASGDGDVNGDGATDITDAKCVAYYAIGVALPPSCGTFDEARADVALPIGIDITDARVIAQAAIGIVTLSAIKDTVLLSPNPVTIDIAQFITTGSVTEMQVEIFDLAGKRLFDSGFIEGNELRWHLVSDQGDVPANGVYLYIVTIVDLDGAIKRGEVRKLVVLR